MSAAEHAHPEPDQPGTVILFRTANRPPRRNARRERTTVPAQPDPSLTPQERLAARIERLFADHGRSLTDDGTTQDFLITLGFVRTMLEGAGRQGLIDDTQRQDLDAMVEGMMAAPGLLNPG